MKEITRYTYLNLETRPDRRLLAECTAWRDHIPGEFVHFWTGEGAFQTWDEIGRHAVEEHGFENFKPCIGQDKPIVGTVIGQMYNVALYLKDRVTREGTLEVFLHDDACFATPLVGQAHDHLNGLCRVLQQDGELNMLLLNPSYFGSVMLKHFKDPPIFRPNGVYIGDSVYEGIRGGCDFAMVLSTKGAEYLLNLVLKHPPWRAVKVLLNIENWDLPGIFTTVFPYVERYSNLIVGTDTFKAAAETPDMYM